MCGQSCATFDRTLPPLQSLLVHLTSVTMATFAFGQYKAKMSQIFFKSKLSYGTFGYIICTCCHSTRVFCTKGL